jgi:hypothetical protein
MPKPAQGLQHHLLHHLLVLLELLLLLGLVLVLRLLLLLLQCLPLLPVHHLRVAVSAAACSPAVAA